jgi:ABC-type multidrug transport system fused ATPase/permease subunit
VQAHLDDFNLAQEFGTYGRIKGLSGGQKVKLVLAAAFWTVPHILVSDFFFFNVCKHPFAFPCFCVVIFKSAFS